MSCSLNVSCNNDTFGVFEEGREIDSLDMHIGVIFLGVDGIGSLELCLAALVFGIGSSLNAHGVEVHSCSREFGFGAYLIGTDV